MKPKTKEQKKVWQLYKKLRTDAYVKVLKWHMKEVVDNYAIISEKGRCSCLKCGHVWKINMSNQKWQDEILLTELKCPNCKIKLNAEISNRRTSYGYWYFSTIETIEDYQVINVFQRYVSFKSKEKPTSWHQKVSTLFISPKGVRTMVGRYKMNHWSEHWCGLMEIRTNTSNFIRNASLYPVYEVIHEISRNGFSYEFYDNSPAILFTKLLSDSTCETLWKAGQYELVKDYSDYAEKNFKKYWGSIKICLRNNYFIKNANEWFDHLELLEHYGKDLHNAKYVCPKDFQKEHQKYIERKRKEDNKKAYLELQAQIKKDEAAYKKHITRYKDFCINYNDLIITPILTVKQLKTESNFLKHCAYASKYHQKEHSLMLSASYNGVVLETIQFDLNTYKVSQARGLRNQNSKMHNLIVKVINDHSKEILSLKKPIRKKPKRKTQKAA